MTTLDYNRFSFINTNRHINEGLVKRIMYSIQQIGWQPGKSILVKKASINKSMEVIDGQHRYEACKRLGLPIDYEITNSDAHKTLIHLNANQETWRLHDYIHSWAESGISCYKRVIEFEAKYGLGCSNTTAILFGNTTGESVANRIRKGYTFKVNPNADKIVKFLEDCKVVPYWRTAKFVSAVTHLHNIADDDQLSKVKNNIISLPQQVKHTDYMMAFENIVNRGKRPANRVSFKST